MSAAAAIAANGRNRIGDSRLAARLRRELKGDVLFDAFSRGRYSTDASIYQIEPVGVVVPQEPDDIARAVQIAREEGVPVLPRGGGTSQCGQTVGAALVVDCSKHLDKLVALDVGGQSAIVQPGMVLDRLNKALKPHGLWFPVDVSTGNRATIGGMTANNSCGARSLHYGNMVHNVRAIDAVLADGSAFRLGPTSGVLDPSIGPVRYVDLIRRMRDLYVTESAEIAERFPNLLRRVGGYNIDMVNPQGHNMAHLLVGSEGTLGFFREIELQLHRIPPHKVLGICHFPRFYQAMASTKQIVALKPTAVELVDRTMIDLAREIAQFRPVVDRFVKGEPDALLLVEFAGEGRELQHRKLKELVELMADLGLPGAVVEATDPAFQSAVWDIRKQGLNIMMSMKGDGKPVSFIEDCAVGLDDLAEYTDKLTQVFHKHGTTGTWYAHASVGCLHVRPILNMKDGADVKKMRAIAEEAFAMVREYKGSHSGEHGDGLVRSEFHEAMFGPKIVAAFREVKRAFDPEGLFNPGKIVDPSKMDDRSLFRFKPGYRALPVDTALDWSEWGGFDRAIEMCNNNGECRKSDPGVMCPSFRATADERHLTRGRANTLRLAVTGQLGPDALTSEAMHETMSLCVSCKGCKRECPTGVDMARMKIEFLNQWQRRHGLSLRDRLIAYLPRYAPVVSRIGGLLNAVGSISTLRRFLESFLGFSARRPLPRWHAAPFRSAAITPDVHNDGKEIVLFVDTFTTWFEPENADAALDVLQAAGYRVHIARSAGAGRPLCCGRTFLAAGLVDEAKVEARRMLDALRPYVERGIAIVGLEPSCLLTLRDEYTAMLPGAEASALAGHAMLFEEFLAAEHAAERLDLKLETLPESRALLHGHCHQKAFGAVGAVERLLKLVPGLQVTTFDSTCCGMAGAFGYQAEHFDMSMKIGELGVLPAVRTTTQDTIIVADGTSCRSQIEDGTGRRAVHAAIVLQRALAASY